MAQNQQQQQQGLSTLNKTVIGIISFAALFLIVAALYTGAGGKAIKPLVLS